MAVTTVVAKFVADVSDFTNKMGAVQSQVNQLGGRMQSTGDSMVAMGRGMSAISLPLLAVGAASVKMAMDFESSMTKMVTLVGLTDDEVSGMSDQIRSMAAQFGISANEAADAMFFIQSAGLRGAAAMEVLEASLKASRMGLGETKTIADLATSALNAYGAENLSATQATAHLHAAVREGKLEASELAGAMGAVLPVASAMGVSFGEVAGMMAGMSRTGTNAGQATTQLRGIMNSLLKPTQQAEKALNDMGLSSEGLRQQVKEKGLLSVLQTLQERFGDNTAATAEVFGNVRALSGVLDLMGASAETNAGIIDSVMNASLDDFNAASERAGETTEAKFNTAIANMKNVLIDIGNIIIPVATSVMEAFTGIAGIIKQVPGPVMNIVVAFGGLIALAGPLLWMTGGVIKGLGGMMIAFSALNARVLQFTGVFLASMRTMALNARAALDTVRLNVMLTGISFKTFGALTATVATTVKGAFAAMRVAVVGFIAALGPVGLAIIGVSTAYMVLAGRSAEAEAKVDSLTEAMQKQGDAAYAETIKLITDALYEMPRAIGLFGAEGGNAVDVLDRLGLQHEDLVLAVINGTEAQKEFMDAVKEKAAGQEEEFIRVQRVEKAMRDLSDSYNAASKNVDLANEKHETAEKAMAAAGISASDLDSDLAGLGGSFDEVTGAADDAAKAIETLSDLFDEVDAQANAIRARNDFVEMLSEMDKSINKTNKNLLGQGKVSRDHQEALTSSYEKARDDAVAWGEATGASVADVNKRFQENMTQVKKYAVEQGLDQDDVEKFFGIEHLNIASVEAAAIAATGMANVVFRSVKEAELGSPKVGTAYTVGVVAGISGGAQGVVNRSRRLGEQANDALKAQAEENFRRIGMLAATGFAKGLASGTDRVKLASSLLAQEAAQAARGALRIESPSKVFLEMGAQIGDGLIVGMKSKKKDVASAARDVAGAIIEKAGEIVAEWDTKLGDLRTILDDKLAQADAWASGMRDSLVSAFDIGSAYKSALNAEGQVDAGMWIAGVDAQIAQMDWFGNVLRHIQQHGGPNAQALVDYLAGQGAEGGGAMGQALIDQGLIQTMADKMASVETKADEVAQSMVPGFFKGGIDSAQATYDGFNRQFGPDGAQRKALNRLMDRLSKSMERTVTITVETVFKAARIAGERAAGGPVRAANAYLVGERGPELFIPNSSGNIIPNSAMSLSGMSMPSGRVRGGDGASMTNIQINVSAPPLTDPAEVGRQVVEAVRKYERRSGPVFVSAQ